MWNHRLTPNKMYSDTDCIGAVQLAAWIYGKQEPDLTTIEYKQSGFQPTIPTLLRRFDDWDSVTEEATTRPQQIPEDIPDYYRGVAALRRLRDLTGYPVTGFDYRGLKDEITVTYQTIVSVAGTWTGSKQVAGVHTA